MGVRNLLSGVFKSPAVRDMPSARYVLASLERVLPLCGNYVREADISYRRYIVSQTYRMSEANISCLPLCYSSLTKIDSPSLIALTEYFPSAMRFK